MNIKCKRCNRCKKGNCIGSVVRKNSKIFVLIDAPNADENRDKKPLAEGTALLFNQMMNEHITENFSYSFASCCYSQSPPVSSHIKSCESHWKKFLRMSGAKTILCLGKYSAEAIMGRKMKLSNIVGQHINTEINGVSYDVIFTYNPNYIAENYNKKGGKFEKELNTYSESLDLTHDVLNGIKIERPKIKILTDYDQIIKLISTLDKRPRMSYDYETFGDVTALRPELNHIFEILSVGISFGDETFSFPIEYPKAFKPEQVEKILKAWSNQLPKINGICHNAKYEHKCNFKKFGFSNKTTDTMLMMNIVNELARADLGSTGQYCKISWSGYKVEMADTQKNPKDTPLNDLLLYGGLDAKLTYDCHDVLDIQIKEMPKLTDVLDMKNGFALSLAELEMQGMKISRKKVSEVSEILKKDRMLLEKKFYNLPAVIKTEQWAKRNIKSFKDTDKFNYNSPVQMQHLCLNELKLEIEPRVTWKNKKRTEKYSLDKSALEPFSHNNEVIKSLIDIRSIDAMFTGFLNKYNEMIGPDDCVHTNYGQCEVITGRLNSTNPNLQNIPTRSVVKSVFVSLFKEDGLLGNADYSQLEPRILAGWSGDANMVKALNGGYDLHKYVSSNIFNVLYEEVTDVQRSIGKRQNLGTMYGQTAMGLSKHTGISLKEAEKLQKEYNDKFPDVYGFRNMLQRSCIDNGYVTDLFGSVRHLSNARSTQDGQRNRALRQASNYPIQSTGNMFCLIAVKMLQDEFKRLKLRAVVIGTVHDSIIFDFHKDDIVSVMQTVRRCMLIHNSMPYWKDMLVPMKVDLKVGKNLYEMETYKSKKVKITRKAG